MPNADQQTIAVLAGGVGGAKMAHGLTMAADAGRVTVVVNTADDFDHLGFRICPDLDTVMYTLGGIANPATGWGIAGDTNQVLEGIRAYGGPDWFHLGDRDIATHILRSAALSAGRSLTDITNQLSTALGIASAIVPMSDDPVSTQIETAAGVLSFQDYFVRRRHEDPVVGIVFDGIESATPQARALEAIESADVIIISPSNPLVSIGPILALHQLENMLRSAKAPTVAVSPIIGGRALKGPADAMMSSLGHEASALGVARMYEGLIDGFVIDHTDRDQAPAIEAMDIAVLETDAIMRSESDRGRLAGELLAFAQTINRKVAVSR